MEHLNAAQEVITNNFMQIFGPDNAIVSLAGDIDYAQAKELVTKYFGSF